MTDLIFLDTETTGLGLDDDIWEFAAIRRKPNGEHDELHLFIAHDENKCKHLPEPFLSDHLKRFPGHNQFTSKKRAADLIYDFLADGTPPKPHIVGMVPNFDTERLTRLLGVMIGVNTPLWYHHLIDVETMAVGWLKAKGVDVPLPWNSDDISLMVGVSPTDFERHTAMGDVRWTMALYDAVMGATS